MMWWDDVMDRGNDGISRVRTTGYELDDGVRIRGMVWGSGEGVGWVGFWGGVVSHFEIGDFARSLYEPTFPGLGRRSKTRSVSWRMSRIRLVNPSATAGAAL